MKVNKSEFFRKSVTYLGHIVSKDGIKTDCEKIKVLQNFNFETINFPFLDEDVLHPGIFARLPIVYTFRNLFILLEYVQMLMTSTEETQFLTTKLSKQGFQYHKRFVNFITDTQS